MGPKRIGNNILVNKIPGFNNSMYVFMHMIVLTWFCSWKRKNSDSTHIIDSFENNIISGFQIATSTGPLCNEPMQGVCFIIESFQFVEEADTVNNAAVISGQIISIMKDVCKQAFLMSSPRLMLAMYTCEIQASGNILK